MSGHAGRLAELTGLDDETVKQQIIPYLTTFTTKQALVNHLQDLIGPGPAQKSFIESFADDRFPPAIAPNAVAPSTEPAAVASAYSPTPSKATPGRKTKTKFPSKLPPPRKVDAASFGGVGSVYRKGQDGEDLFSGPSAGTLSRKASPALVPSPSRAESRTPDIHHSAPPQDPPSAPQTMRTVASTAARAASADQDYTVIPTDEMRDVQQSIALLRGDSNEDPTVKAKPCFCQGRKHVLHPHVPLCLTCGLVLCSILSPSPLLLPSPPCPSCAAPILSTTSRAILLTQLDLTLASLRQAHEEKVQLIREERQQAWKEKRKEVDLFPELHQHLGNPSASMTNSNALSGSSMLGQAYNAFHERRRNIDIAMGRKVQDDSQRRSRVLRIESKTAKGKDSSAKKKRKPTNSKEENKQSKNVAVVAGEKSEIDSDQVEEEEAEEGEEAVLDYDFDEQGDGPVADPDDDGFAQHSSAFPQENLDTSSGHGWTKRTNFLPTISYVPKEDRTVEVVDEEEHDSEEGPAKRQVPGSAPKEANVKQKDTHEKGKGKKAAKVES